MPEQTKIMNSLISNDLNSVSLHVRRGDYVNIPRDSYYQFNEVASITYYASAISYMRKK